MRTSLHAPLPVDATRRARRSYALPPLLAIAVGHRWPGSGDRDDHGYGTKEGFDYRPFG